MGAVIDPSTDAFGAALLDYLDRHYGGVEGYLYAAGVTQSDMEQIRKHLVTRE